MKREVKTLKEVLDECLKDIDLYCYISIKIEGEEVGYSSCISLIARDHEITNGTVPENYLNRAVKYYHCTNTTNHLVIIIEHDDASESEPAEKPLTTDEFLEELELLGRDYQVDVEIIKSHRASGSDWHIEFYEKHSDDRGLIFGYISFRFMKDDLRKVLEQVKAVLDEESIVGMIRSGKLFEGIAKLESKLEGID